MGRSENLRDSKRKDNIQRRARTRSSRADDDDDEVDEPDQGFDAGRNQVEGGFQFAGGEEADFDQGEEDCQAGDGDDDGAAGSVGEKKTMLEK
jgi:hypothetical protein